MVTTVSNVHVAKLRTQTGTTSNIGKLVLWYMYEPQASTTGKLQRCQQSTDIIAYFVPTVHVNNCFLESLINYSEWTITPKVASLAVTAQNSMPDIDTQTNT